jgi:hypothetical protein
MQTPDKRTMENGADKYADSLGERFSVVREHAARVIWRHQIVGLLS